MPATYDIDSLIAPLADDAPSGPALDEDPDFLALERVAAGIPERQYGNKVFPAEPPEWPAVYAQALDLAQRSRDLRLAVWLARSGARLHGFGGFVRGLQLVQGLLQQQWDTVHPQFDAEDGNDATMRLNALLPLMAVEAALSDLRASSLSPARGSVTLRELELGLGLAEAHIGEVQPTQAGVLHGLEGLLQSHPAVAEDITTALNTAQAMAALLDDKVGSGAPDAGPLLRLLRVAGTGLQQVQASDVASAEADPDSSDDAEPAARGGGARGDIRSRDDAVRELERVCQWLERHEPSNPAPLLIRRAQRLMNMNFIDIIRDMASNGLEQVETVVGKPPDET